MAPSASLLLLCLTASAAISADARLLQFDSLISMVTNAPSVAADTFSLIGDHPLREEFQVFAARFQKAYSSPAEALLRFRIFTENWQLIHDSNRENKPYTLHVNKFADMSWEEFKGHWLGAQQNCSATRGNHVLSATLAVPASRDWREEGIVSPVKNQGHCGSCWTFSTTGALEAAFKQKTGADVSLSEQQLVDCAFNFNNFGCNGGLPSQAFEYVKYNGGLDTETAYPYKGENEGCTFNPKAVGVKVQDVVNITEFDEAGLQDAVGLVRPVSIAFEVVGDFRFYKEGVYSSTHCKSGPETVNHAVLAVGYDTTSPDPYWIIKNSWGEDWGDQGYFKMALGYNMCGISTCASYPVL